MHVHCPACSTQYEIPPLLRPRRLRCAQCGGEWREVPAAPDQDQGAQDEQGPVARPDDAAAMEAAVPPIPQAVPGLPVAASVAPARAGALVWSMLWLLSLLLIAACLASLWHWRGAVGHHWPPSLRLYRMLPGGVGG